MAILTDNGNTLVDELGNPLTDELPSTAVFDKVAARGQLWRLVIRILIAFIAIS